jgi:hypothetical protein
VYDGDIITEDLAFIGPITEKLANADKAIKVAHMRKLNEIRYKVTI